MSRWDNYQVGGSLPVNASSYVARQADIEFYKHLKGGHFCYVLNARQMGKSSLRVRTIQRLRSEGVICASVDLTGIGKSQVNLEKWYGGFVRELINSLGLENQFDWQKWWLEHRELFSPVHRLSLLFQDVLLTEFSQNIVVFVDEIDRVLGYEFSLDDFFSLIRFFHTQRVNDSHFERLTFALLGVATPSDLIADKAQTPFNIGHAIELKGFQIDEVCPLVKGLEGKVSEPWETMRQILYWTNGQPFLTQKLCQLMIEGGENTSEKVVDALVNEQIIQNWEFQDRPEHLKTIRDRLLANQNQAGRLLGLYQRILNHQSVASNPDSELIAVRLSGIVAIHNNQLQVANKIYQMIFDHQWITKELNRLRPYAESLAAWDASGGLDESRLLRGKALQDALDWGKNKQLSDADYQYLSAGQELEKRNAEKALTTQKEANQVLEQANRQAKRTIRRGLIGFACTIAAAMAGAIAIAQFTRTQIGRVQDLTRIERSGMSAMQQFDSDQIAALILAMKSGQDFQSWVGDASDTQFVWETNAWWSLLNVLVRIREVNQIDGHLSPVIDVQFSHDDQLIATASRDHTVKLWRQDGSFITTLEGHKSWLTSVSFSPDGSFLASGSWDETVKLWTLDGDLIQTLTPNADWIWDVAIAPDHNSIISANKNGTLTLWNRDGPLEKVFKGRHDEAHSVTFSPDGRIIASGGMNGTIHLWQLDGTLLKTWDGHRDNVQSLAFSPDGQMLVSGSWDRTIKLWSLDGTLIRTIQGHTRRVYGVNFSPDGQIIASGGSDGVIRLWRLDGTAIEALSGHNSRIRTVQFSHDGQMLVSTADHMVKVWRRDGPLVLSPSNEVNEGIRSIDFSPNGQFLVTGSNDGSIHRFEIESFGQVPIHQMPSYQFLGHNDEVNSLEFSVDGKRIVSSSRDKTIRIWNGDGTLVRTFPKQEAEELFVTFSPTQDIVASGSADRFIRMWNPDGTLIHEFEAHENHITGVYFNPTGQILASTSKDKSVKLWTLEGTLIATLPNHDGWTDAVSFSPDGQMVITGANQGDIRFWQIDGTPIQTIYGHQGRVERLAFHPTANMFASASADGSIKFWQPDGTLITSLIGHQSGVHSIKFSPDGSILASSGNDGTVILWPLELDALLNQSCEWLGDYLRHQSEDLESSPGCQE